MFYLLDELTLRLEHRRGSGMQSNGAPLANPVHQRLRDGSPLTVALDSKRRRGQQLALSSLVQAFIAMHRISVSQIFQPELPKTYLHIFVNIRFCKKLLRYCPLTKDNRCLMPSRNYLVSDVKQGKSPQKRPRENSL